MSAEKDEEHLICVEYPATIKNKDKMIETLGGYESINEVISQPNRKMELKFRPNVPGCKPTCAERVKTSSILVKAKMLKNKKTGETKVVHEIVGPVEASYKFSGLCDFQYLPMVRKDSQYESIKSQTMLDHLPTTKEMEEEGNTPLFLPPMAFSRTDTIQDYHFRRDTEKKDLPENIIGRTRQRRSLYNCFLTYDAENVPDKPNEAAIEQLENFGVEPKHIEKIKELFEEQKIWLKAELAHKCQVPYKHIKSILPVVAYYFSSGPWRNQWIKFGYDPRKDIDAAPMQTLDYRLRFRAGAIHQLVESKRKSLTMSRHKVTSASKAKTSVIDLNASTDKTDINETELVEQEEKLRDAYLFRPGRLPPSRQVFYQYKNIIVSDAQILIKKFKLSGNAAAVKCDEKNGWYKKGLDEKLRRILAETIKQTCFEDDNVSLAATNVTAMEDVTADFSSDSDEDL